MNTNKEDTRKPRLKCRNGPECGYLKRNSCLYRHDEDAREEDRQVDDEDKRRKQKPEIGRKEGNVKEETNKNDENKRDGNFLEQIRRNNNKKKDTETLQAWENFY